MKLKNNAPNIESSDGMEEKLFSIGNAAIIFDILRNKMYSDPIRTICREISCNALDAHREVGKSDIPIEITLPNHFEKFYKIKDYGPGISPDRVENIYIKYANSTKRDTNDLIGSFGIGSKSPFSYTDSFSINTTVNGIKYSYSCFIDETKIGKLICMNSESTQEQNSTEIIIPVKSQDFSKFIQDTEYVCRHWPVKPIIHGGKIDFEKHDFYLQGNDYALAKGNNYNHELKLIVDGIEYPCDINQLGVSSQNSLMRNVSGVFFLYFKTGEISLSATREAVHLDKDTKNKIAEKLNIVSKEIKNDILNKIDSCENLWKANVWVNNSLSRYFNINSLGRDLVYKETPITLGYIRFGTDAQVINFTKGYTTNSGTKYPDRIRKDTNSYIPFTSEEKEIYLCDFDILDIQTKQVQPAFDANPDLKNVYVIKLRSHAEEYTFDNLIKDYHLDRYGFKKLSEIAKAPKVRKESKQKLLVFKFNDVTGNFNQIAIAEVEKDPKKKVICSVHKDPYNSHRYFYLNGRGHSFNSIKGLIANSDYSIYGVDEDIPEERVKEEFPNYKTISELFEDIYSQKFDIMKIKALEKVKYEISNLADHFESLKKKIKNKNSDYYKFLTLVEEIHDFQKNEVDLSLYEIIKGEVPDKDIMEWLDKNPKFKFYEQKEAVNKKYPLIQHISLYNQRKLLQDVADYISLIDGE